MDKEKWGIKFNRLIGLVSALMVKHLLLLK